MTRLQYGLLVLSCLALAPGSASAGQKKLPADLAFVPPNCAGFGHVRLLDVWKSEHAREWRDTLNLAGEEALKAFDARIFPRPSTLERATFFVPIRDRFGRNDGDEPILVLAFSKAIDRASFMKYTVPSAKEESVDDYLKKDMKTTKPSEDVEKKPEKGKSPKTDKGTGLKFLVDRSRNLAIFFVDDKTLAVGQPPSLQRVLAAPRVPQGTLTEALHHASEGAKPIVLALNHEIVPTSAARLLVPEEIVPLTKFKLAMASIDLEKEGHVDLRVTFGGVAEAAAALTSAKDGIVMGRNLLAQGRAEMERDVAGDGTPGSLADLPKAAASLAVLGFLNQLDDYVTRLPLKVSGNALTLSVKIPQGSQAILASYAGVGALGWAFYRENSAARTMQEPPARAREVLTGDRLASANNLKQIALAMHNYHSAYNTFPAAAICAKNRKPLLSWRVAILPFLEEGRLYEEFKLDEPWDSAHNKKLIPRMPKVYVIPAAPKKAGETYYRVFVGNGAAFDLMKETAITAITDGSSRTIMCVEASESVPWTKPDELVYDPKKPLPKSPNFYKNGVYMAAFCDGSVHSLRNNLSEATLRALITRAAGDIPGKDFDD